MACKTKLISVPLKASSLAFLIALLFAPLPLFAALSFNGTNQFVTFGVSPKLGAPAFTIETWFNWTGGGVPATTGNGGVMAIPLVAKMAAEFDGDNRDGNYFLGIRPGDAVLVADLEEGAKGVAPGTNHPITGVTAVTSNAWHHAAVTYNGTNWALFLDGQLESTLVIGQPPRFDTIQHAGLASSLNSGGGPQGFFAGMLDEVRIWKYARSAAEISANRNVQIPSGDGLIGRWSLTETNGLLAHDTSSNAIDGMLIKGPVWINDNRAKADVFAPLKLTVVDPERTKVLRLAEAQLVPPVFRFDPGLAQEVEKSFRTNFLITRAAFLSALDRSFPGRPKDSLAGIEPRFAQFLSAFQRTNNNFPAGASTVRKWAEAHVDSLTQSNLALRLRTGMSRYIHADSLPEDAKAAVGDVRLYIMNLTNAAPNVDTGESQVLNTARTNLFPLARGRLEFQQSFPSNEQATASYVARFIRENCAFDPKVTRQSRAARVASIFATDSYEPGQMLVKKGQVIDSKISAALDELKNQMAAAEDIKARTAGEHAKTEDAIRTLQAQSAMSEFKSRHFGQQNRWLFWGLVIVAVTSSIAVWQLARSKRASSQFAVSISSGQSELDPGERPEGMDEAEWKKRALIAERRAAQTSEVLRAGLIPHIAEWLKLKLVRGLMNERSHLLKMQAMAELELAELDQRLANLQAPFEERLRVYQERIFELERELAAKGEENRVLIQARIDSTRRKLEAEQARSRTTWT